ncbi:helix-turn-helix domain-containing protein [Aromatoleum toluclasticum]|uniref:helix-turn-helix domain-containing protein n=1 Tax=Aromatoleum toluclasticum TaxID=92003 RepID=UPI000376E96F|nr:helix-turn-helix domain-containing protein [Aromatoleum toluclasticum]
MKSIRALERGLEVLQLLRQSEGRSLQQLHDATGLPKPTLLRILHTLEQAGIAWRAIHDGLWRRAIALPAAQRPPEATQRLAELAAPHLAALQRKALWPSDLLVYKDYMMELAESSRRLSGLSLNPRYHLGYRVDLFLSAPGRAWLAFCTQAQRNDVMAHYRTHPPENPRSAIVLRREIDAILDETRRQGYAVRDAIFGGGVEDISEFDDGLDAIAVPVLAADGVQGCINMIWPRRYGLRAKVVEAHLGDLQATAAAIAAARDAAAPVAAG